jgi:hypothetical protein
MNINTRNFIIGIAVSIAIFIAQYFIHGPDAARLFITTGVGVLTAMITGYILYKEY